jgi:hypothetical protein
VKVVSGAAGKGSLHCVEGYRTKSTPFGKVVSACPAAPPSYIHIQTSL